MFLIIAALFFVKLAEGLNLQEVVEPVSFTITPDPTFNETWAFSVPLWCQPMSSKADLWGSVMYQTGAEQFAKLTEDDMKKSCFYYKLDNPLCTYYIFDAVDSIEVNPNPYRVGIWDWTTVPRGDKPREFVATSYILLSDNENAIVFLNDWSTGLKSWSIAANAESCKISNEFLKKAKKLLFTDLKFREDLVYTDTYEQCKSADKIYFSKCKEAHPL